MVTFPRGFSMVTFPMEDSVVTFLLEVGFHGNLIPDSFLVAFW